MRLGAEAFMSRHVLFTTLTFNDENLHKGQRMDHKPFKQYIQNLRRAGHVVKYLGAFELGKKTARPHYHAILCFGEEGKPPEFPLNVRADLKHWKNGNSQYELPRSKAGSLQYTLGYVSKGGGEVLRPSNNFGKQFLINYAAMLGGNKRTLVQSIKGHELIRVNVPGVTVKAKGLDGLGKVKTFDFPVAHPWAAEMAQAYIEAYTEKYGVEPPRSAIGNMGGDW